MHWFLLALAASGCSQQLAVFWLLAAAKCTPKSKQSAPPLLVAVFAYVLLTYFLCLCFLGGALFLDFVRGARYLVVLVVLMALAVEGGRHR